MSELMMTIDGREAPTLATLSVEDPATGAVTAIAPNCTSEQLDSAMQAASNAFPGWRQDRGERQRALRGLAEAMTTHLDELAELITTEEGKPLSESKSEIEGATGELLYFADFEAHDDVLQDNPRATVKVIRRPIGVVGAITPWNFPLGTSVAKIAPALAAGCTMVLKPSPFTPLSCLRFGELTREVLPAGVLNVLSGSDQVGAWISEHPIPRMTSFTGSVATGKRVRDRSSHGPQAHHPRARRQRPCNRPRGRRHLTSRRRFVRQCLWQLRTDLRRHQARLRAGRTPRRARRSARRTREGRKGG